MKIIIKILFCLILFSCVQKKNNIEQEDEFLSEKLGRNELYIFFDEQINYYLEDINAGAQDFYFLFKETDSNDTLFSFSFFVEKGLPLNELDYKGFLKIDSFKIAIYDAKNLMIDYYKDSLYKEPFPNKKNYLGIKRETGIIMCLVSTGWLKNGKLEIIPSVELARKEWDIYSMK